jgi:hypothetical protein
MIILGSNCKMHYPHLSLVCLASSYLHPKTLLFSFIYNTTVIRFCSFFPISLFPTEPRSLYYFRKYYSLFIVFDSISFLFFIVLYLRFSSFLNHIFPSVSKHHSVIYHNGKRKNSYQYFRYWSCQCS